VAAICSHEIVQDLHAQEACMATVDNFFSAEPDQSRLMAFANRSEGDGQLPLYRFGVVGYGSAGGMVGCGGAALRRLLGPYSTFAGVHGTARDFTGVAGTSISHVGVYGQLEDNIFVPDVLHAGVLGTAGTQPGVIGFSTSSDGVQGVSFQGSGIRGTSLAGSGVSGRSVSFISSGVRGVVQIEGPPPGMGIRPAAGVLGTASDAPGVIGTSDARIGVYGFSTANAGVVGESVNSFAGFFAGNVMVTGNLTVGGVISPNPKLAVMPFPDGTHRALYCMESPEVWFEDFGAARLKRGRALVKIDADFAKVIKRGDYRVFVTPEGDCRGLYIRRKQATSFEVRELGGGKSSVAFSYRIVGRRKDIGRHTRFAKIDARLAKIDTRLPLPAVRGRRPTPTLRAFIAEIEKEARAKATPAMRKSDREVAALPPPEDVPF
jgi:hypothetical protein